MEALKRVIVELQTAETILESDPKNPTVKGILETARAELTAIIHKLRSDTPNPTTPDDTTTQQQQQAAASAGNDSGTAA